MSRNPGTKSASKSQLGRAIIILLLVANVFILLAPWAIRTVSASRLELGYNIASGNTRWLGLVQKGMLRPLDRGMFSSRFTRMGMQEARAPETDELDLGPYEGSVVVIEGLDGGGWVYSARVEDVIDTPLLAQLLRYGWVLRP